LGNLSEMDRYDEEGWFQDPYRLHEERWYSDGEPTKLVRDSGVESYDALPSDAPQVGPLVRPSDTQPSSCSDDLRRADDPGAGVPPDYSATGEVQKYTPVPPRH
jgi:hypothetical protein